MRQNLIVPFTLITKIDDVNLIGLVYFTDLVEELDRAISGAKYGDYIMTGKLVLK